MAHKPNLFLIGAMKSGTTYLCTLLDAHPSIFMCRPEEPSYFVDSRQLKTLWPDMWDQGFWRSEDRYLRLFQSAEDAAILGEASTNYTKRPMVSGVAEKIHGFNPDARMIYLLRDPVERTISHYWHMVRYHAEHRRMLDAIKEDPQFLDVSYYAMQLTPFLDRFGGDRVKVLIHEQLISAPRETMRSLYSWLGVDPSTADGSHFEQPENVTPEVVHMATGLGLLPRLRQSRAMRALAPRLPLSVRRTALRLATRDVHRRSIDTSDVMSYLRPIQRKQTEELEQLLGRKFPEWTTLNPDPPKQCLTGTSTDAVPKAPYTSPESCASRWNLVWHARAAMAAAIKLLISGDLP